MNTKLFFSSLKKTTFIFFTLLLYSVFPRQVFAEESDPIGTITKPDAIKNFDSAGGIGESEIGIFAFGSRLLVYVTIIAGLWSFFNLIFAAYTYITSSGNAQIHTKVRDQLTMSLLGMILIVTVYSVGALIGTIFFGNATYLINPTIQGPGAL